MLGIAMTRALSTTITIVSSALTQQLAANVTDAAKRSSSYSREQRADDNAQNIRARQFPSPHNDYCSECLGNDLENAALPLAERKCLLSSR